MSIPSPILIFGDPYTSKNYVIAAKKKYPDVRWVTKSATSETLDSITMEAGMGSWDDSEKILVIEDLPDRKQVRDFLIRLANSKPENCKLLIWDSNQQIKMDPKEQTLEKTWGEFVSAFKEIEGNKVINCGEQLNEKSSEDTISYVSNLFAKYNRQIAIKEVKLLISIVGHNKGMLDSDIKKMILTAPATIDANFIIENAFPSTKESLIYKLGNILDGSSYEDAMNLMERFLASDINPNVIAEVFVRKARWQMAVASFWHQGIPFSDIPNRIINMGKFPSAVWHNEELNDTGRINASESLQDREGMLNYLERKMGIPDRYFKPEKETKSKSKKTKGSMSRKNSETLPMYFMAAQTVDFVKDSIVGDKQVTPELKKKVLNRAITIYLFIQEKLASIRYGDNPEQDLREMTRLLMNTNLDAF